MENLQLIEWLESMVKNHRVLAARTTEVNKQLHQERVFAYQHVLKQLGSDTFKTKEECLLENATTGAMVGELLSRLDNQSPVYNGVDGPDMDNKNGK